MARAPDERVKEAETLFNQGLKLVEISKKLNIPEGTVRSWKNRYKWGSNKNATLQKEKRNVAKKKAKPQKDFREKLTEEDINNGLTEKQRLFCLYYIKSFNATMAAVKAGYSPESAYQIGYENLRKPEIAKEIRRLKGAVQSELFIDAMDVLERYIKIAFADMNDFVEFGQEEVPVMGMFGPIEVEDPETGEKKPLTKIVNVIKFKESSMVDGSLICQVKQGRDGVSVKLEDRQKALDKLALYFDLFPDKFQRRIEEEKLKLEKLKTTGEGQGSTQEGIDNFIKATTMSPEEIKAIFEGEEDENIQKEKD